VSTVAGKNDDGGIEDDGDIPFGLVLMGTPPADKTYLPRISTQELDA
jgi:hypothetical protein